MKSAIKAVLVLSSLSACTMPHVDVAKNETVGGAYIRTMAKEYARLAVWERDQYDWPDAALFAAKAGRAKAGEIPLEEAPEHWRLDAHNRHQAAILRERLQRYRAAAAPRRWPQTAALAQIYYDCWVEQREEGWQQSHIDACRQGMEARLMDLAAFMPWAAGAPEALQIGFATARFDLSASEKARLKEFLDRAMDRGITRFLVQGHADRQGGRSFNRLLSERRAATVATWMRRYLHGKKIRIKTAALGEMLPLVPTADGRAKAENRRASVFACPVRCPGEVPEDALPIAVPTVDRRAPVLAAADRGGR